jgi:hypothetical protein
MTADPQVSLDNRPLAFHASSMYCLAWHICRRGGGAHRFLPVVTLGHELGFLIANRDLNAVGANANGGKRAGGNTIA